ncbi:PBP1A family penicillin-binding protein [candidate division KSB1 bacterium]|nr:PBP1A family penicillin-binding protein [candidate division KSB1 bacterium]
MRRRIRNYNQHENNSIDKEAIRRKILKNLLILAAAGLIAFIGWVIYLSLDLPSLTQLEHYDPELATKIYSIDGKVIKELYTQKRILIPLEEAPDYMWQAVIATEDHIFFDHWGINLKRFAYAMMINIAHFRYKQGASTITQQLARQLYLGLEKKVSRKIREWITAIQIERTYTKHEILEMYLNHMNFGHGNYGIQAASLEFFGKNAKDMTLEECALLAGLLQRPTAYSPVRHPDRAKRRRNIVLHNMWKRKYIDEETYYETVNEPVVVKPYSKEDEYGVAPYFTEHIRQELQDRYHMDLYKGGYSVYTTLDTRVQAAAEEAVDNHLPQLQKKFNQRLIKTNKLKRYLPKDLLNRIPYEQLINNESLVDSMANKHVPIQIAFVALNPKNGYILAMIGGRDFGESKYNRAIQMKQRQPGSTIKPIVYTAAIDNGYSPTTELLNQPVVLYLPNGDRWAPHNYDYSQGGPTTFREALRRSLNLVTARVVQEIVPPKTVIDYARKLGITTPLEPVDAIALGAAQVIPIELTSAFGVFANQGALAKPLAILRVEDKYGNVLEEYRPQLTHVLRAETSYIMVNLLETVLNRGTGYTARSVYKFLRPAGGKTGTTNEFTDAWFIGFTPQIVSGVWVGLDNPAISLGSGQTGAQAALPIWAPFMKTAHDTLELPIEYFHMPPGVSRVDICNETKMLATEYCPDIITEVFETDNVPTQYCDKHTGFDSRTIKSSKTKKRIRF